MHLTHVPCLPPSLWLPAAATQDGKSLYTTIREFVENALDAAESIGVLPSVDITMCAACSPLLRCPTVALPLTLNSVLQRRDFFRALCVAGGP